MITTKQFEKELQKKVDKRINIRINPNANDIAGVYLGNLYLQVAVPAHHIKEKHDPFYTDKNGYPHRTRAEAEFLVKAKLKGMTQEKYNLLSNDRWND